MRELEEVAAKARAAAITAQARAEAINNIGGRVEQEIDEMYKTLERAEAIRIDLSAFVEHGDKVVEKLDKLIRGMGGRNGG